MSGWTPDGHGFEFQASFFSQFIPFHYDSYRSKKKVTTILKIAALAIFTALNCYIITHTWYLANQPLKVKFLSLVSFSICSSRIILLYYYQCIIIHSALVRVSFLNLQFFWLIQEVQVDEERRQTWGRHQLLNNFVLYFHVFSFFLAILGVNLRGRFCWFRWR